MIHYIEAWANENLGGKSLEATLKGKLSGDFEDACLALFKDSVDNVCVQLKAAFSGVGCDEALVSRALGGLDKDDAIAVKARYFEKYNHDLNEIISKETGSNYQKALLGWLNYADPSQGLVYNFSRNVHDPSYVAQYVVNLKVRQCSTTPSLSVCVWV